VSYAPIGAISYFSTGNSGENIGSVSPYIVQWGIQQDSLGITVNDGVFMLPLGLFLFSFNGNEDGLSVTAFKFLWNGDNLNTGTSYLINTNIEPNTMYCEVVFTVPEDGTIVQGSVTFVKFA